MYKRYEKYKDSGVEWIGEIPEHWSISKVKYQADINSKTLNEKTPETFEMEYLDISNVDSDGEIMKIEPMLFRDAPSRARRIVFDGDTVVSTVRTYLKAITWFNKVENNLICSTGFAVLSPKNTMEPKYLSYLVRSPLYVEEIVSRSVGVSYPAITSTEIGNLECIMPLGITNYINEQKNIVNFLDHKTSEIDFLIADKEELIKKLEEYKQSIITEAVTKGLNPDVKMKDSGIEWIGEIPEHWDLAKIKYLLKRKKNAIKVGPFGSQLTADEMAHNQVKVYNQRNVYDKDYSKGENYISRDKYETLKSFTLYPEDILVTTRGTIGQAYVLPEGCEMGILHPCLMRIQVKNDLINYRFIEEIFNETNIVANQIFYESNSTTIEVIYSETLKNLFLPLPELDEQYMILNEIDRIKRLYESLINDVQTQIQNLKSYRQSLIFEAVTGKIDVRDYQPERSEQLA